MVEAICVISIFILVFLGMVYFQSMYHSQLRAQQLGRAASIAYAMDACGDPSSLQSVQQDLGNAKDNGSSSNPQPNQGAGSSVNSSQPVGNNGGDPLSGALSQGGFSGDPIADIRLIGWGAGTTKNGLFGSRFGFKSTVSSTSHVSCGDKQQKGNAGDVFSFAKNAIKL